MPHRRQFLQTVLTGVGSAALGASGGGVADAAVLTHASGTFPGWVPKGGGSVAGVATVNNFLSQNGNLAGWESEFGKIVDDYSGGVFNPYWGPMGAMVFHGGGHSATFDNSVVILDLNDLKFKRLSTPTASNNGANWRSTTGLPRNIDTAFNTLYCEYGDGQPGAGHTYDSLAILPPDRGGAPCGSLVRVSSFAVHVNMSRNTGWAHRFDFQSTAMRDGQWTRWSVNGLTSYLSPGACSTYDSHRNRFWWIAGLSSLPRMIRYLDVATAQQVEIPFAEAGLSAPAANPDSVTMRYEPERDILVLTCTSGGQFVLAILRCASPELGWLVTPLSAPIPAKLGASHPFDFVPEADKFVLLTPADNSALYDIVPPRDPLLTWDVIRQPLNGTQIPTAYVVGKRWSYAPSLKSFVWMARSTSRVVAYRPVGV